MRVLTATVASLLSFSGLSGQSASELSPGVLEYVIVAAPTFALTNVRVVDGTGAPPRNVQTVVVVDGRIRDVGPTGSVSVPAGAEILELSGHTVIPGIIGMHDHTDYAGARGRLTLSFSAPRIYLASGVTTIRTAGSLWRVE